MPQSKMERLFFGVILAGYLLLGALFALRTPDWQAPDEPAHYNYIAQVVQNGCCPIIEEGDWQQDYQDALTAERFAPELLDRLDTLQYQDHQPPLYYLAAAPLFALTDGSLRALRLFSVLLGAGVLACAWFVAREVFPARPWLAAAAMALVAFLPQHVAVLAAVTNDALAFPLMGLMLLFTLRYLRGGTVRPWMLGLLVGVAFMTKTTTYLYAGVALLALLLRWRREGAGRDVLLRTLAAFLLPALLLGGLWWMRNLSVYGLPDFFGLRAHDVVVLGQLRTADLIAQVGMGQYLSSALQTTFNSFWGQFGWMALPLEGRFYLGIQLVLLLALAGLALLALRPALRGPGPVPPALAHLTPDPPAVQRDVRLLLSVTALLALLMLMYYNTSFVQFQGRYLYPGLIPLALGLAAGLDVWRRLLTGGRAWALWLLPLVWFPLAGVALYMLLRHIPSLAP